MARTQGSWEEYEGSYVAVPWAEGRDILIRGTGKYVNFGTITGASGYGIRDNAGILQFKNSGGSWTNFGSGGTGGGDMFKSVYDTNDNGIVDAAEMLETDTTSTGGATLGQIKWDNDVNNFVFGVDGASIVLGSPFWFVKNQTGATITKGTPVYANGTLGVSGRITIAKMIADGSVLPRYYLGVAATDITNGADGLAITQGVIRQINTSSFSNGQVLYPSASTAGTFTATEPTAPNISLASAFVIHSDASVGSIAVRVSNLNENAYATYAQGLLADTAVQPSDLALVATSGDYNDLSNKPDLSVYDSFDQYANLAAFPATGSADKVYVAQDTGYIYRWNGSGYSQMSAELALGETSTTAYRGDRGKIAYDHSLLTSGNPHNVTKSDVGLGNVDNTSDLNKPISTATQTALNAKEATANKDVSGGYAGLTLLKLNMRNVANTFTSFFTNTNTASRTYTLPDKDGTVAMTSDITGTNSGTNTGDQTITLTSDVTGSGTGLFATTIAPGVVSNSKLANVATATFKGRTTAGTGSPEDLTATQATDLLNTFDSSNKGLAPASGGGTTNFLRADGSWAVPSGGGGSTLETIAQTSHGLSAGDLIRSNGTNNQFAKVQANSSANVEVIGRVVTITDANNFTYEPFGKIMTNNVPAVAAGTVMFADPTTAGAMTATEPTTAGQVSKPVAIVIANGSKMLGLNMRGMVVSAPGTGGDVVGPASATDTAIALFDGTTGKLIKNSTAKYTSDSALQLPLSTSTTASASDTVKIFGRKIANRMMLAQIGASGLDTTLQPLLARNKIGFWNPPGNVITVPGVFGFTAPTVVGTATARTVATTNGATRMRRLGYVSAATAGALAEARVAAAQFSCGSGSNDGSGFFYVTRFVPSNAAAVSGERFFIGLTNSTAAATNVEPNALTNCIGIAQLSTDNTQFYLVYGGSTAQTAVALGTSLGAPNTLSTAAYELAIFAPNSTANTYYILVTNIFTGATYATTLTGAATVVPQSSTLLAHRAWKTNNATALAVGFDIASIYIETDT